MATDTALLLFQSRAVSHARIVFQVNVIQVFGGLPSPSGETPATAMCSC